MRIMRWGLLALLCLTFCSVALAYTEVPDLGPKLRDFDASKDCNCVKSSIARKQALLNNYRQLAESYNNMLKDLGDGLNTPTWVDPNILSKQQINRLIAFNNDFDAKEKELEKGAAEADCGFPPDKSIVLQTNSVTGEPPSRQEQQEAKPFFPCEQVYDAVMLHEYYHAGEWSAHNTGRNTPAGRLPRTRTPYGRALEEAKGYQIEINALKQLANKCNGWKLEGWGPGTGVIHNTGGLSCGSPYGPWKFKGEYIVPSGTSSSSEDIPFSKDGKSTSTHEEHVRGLSDVTADIVGTSKVTITPNSKGYQINFGATPVTETACRQGVCRTQKGVKRAWVINIVPAEPGECSKP